MQPRSDGSDRHAENSGDLRQGEVEVVLEHEDSPLLRGQAAEAALQLVAVGDAELRVAAAGIGIEHAKRRAPPPLPACLGIAGVDDDAVGPGLEAGRVAQPWKLAPDSDDRLL